MRFPPFTIDGYRQLCQALAEHYPGGRNLYMRHDIDAHITGADIIGAIDSEYGIRSTWFVQAAAHYNPASHHNRAILRRLIWQGHTIGLHYDLADYPLDDFDAALERLVEDSALLVLVTGQKIEHVTMHSPTLGHEDMFRELPMNPHSWGWEYVSDSCRAWRDDELRFPEKLHLNTHHEHWLKTSVMERDEFAAELEDEMTAEAFGAWATIRQEWQRNLAQR